MPISGETGHGKNGGRGTLERVGANWNIGVSGVTDPGLKKISQAQTRALLSFCFYICYMISHSGTTVCGGTLQLFGNLA